jgi:hypothetical protein
MLHLQAGKYFRTRDGKKAKVIGRLDEPAAAEWLVQHEGDGLALYHFSDGCVNRSIGYGIGALCPVREHDLVEEWREPVSREQAVTMWRSGPQRSGPHIHCTTAFTSLDDAKRGIADGCVIAFKTITITEGEGL